MKVPHPNVPDALREAFEAEGLERRTVNLNMLSEVEQAYSLYLTGFSVREAALFVIHNRGKV